MWQTQKPVFVPKAAGARMSRVEIVPKFKIAAIALVPFEAGVMEFGTSEGAETATWPSDFESIPKPPPLPKDQMRNAYEGLGASYTMFWALGADKKQYSVVADYVTESRREALAKVRGDDKTFCSESRKLALDAAGTGPVATAMRTGETQVVDDVTAMKRAALAEEFRVTKIIFTPVEGGVLEYGIPVTTSLDSSLLAATLKLRVETSGAGYALYWKDTGGIFTVAGSYLPPARELVLIKQGGAGLSYAKASENVTLDVDGEGPVSKTYKSQVPIFIEDVMSFGKLKRQALAEEYGIASICFAPVEGGVIEYGTSRGPETADWRSVDDAFVDALPRGEIRKAFATGATHLIFWKQVADRYVVRGDYVVPERLRALRQSRGDDDSYTSRSEDMVLSANGEGPIATAQRSGREVIIDDATTAVNFRRRELALEFGINDCHFVPLAEGVLEYGSASTVVSDEQRAAATDEVQPFASKSAVSALSEQSAQPPSTLTPQPGAAEAPPQTQAQAQLRSTEIARAVAASAAALGPSLEESTYMVSTTLAAVAQAPWGRGALGEPASADEQLRLFSEDEQFARVRQLNRYAKLELQLTRTQDDNRVLRGRTQVARRATLIAPLAAISVLSFAQYAATPGFDFPGLDTLKGLWRLQAIGDKEKLAEEATNRFFPGSLSSGATDHLVQKTLSKRGFTAENTLLATSVCPDEVNSKTGELTDLLKTRYGEAFTLGGLGGVPFTGTAGFTAYSHHVPDSGKMFVIFAPHVGIESVGNVGKLKRPSQAGTSSACGASIGAFNALNKEAAAALEDQGEEAIVDGVAVKKMANDKDEDEQPFDAQIAFIKKRLDARLIGIEDQPDPIAFVTYQMYWIMREFFTVELKKAPAIWDYAEELTVLGGIQINRNNGGDRFMPLMFQTRKQDYRSNVDLFEETFGPKPDLRPVIGEKSARLQYNLFNSKI